MRRLLVVCAAIAAFASCQDDAPPPTTAPPVTLALTTTSVATTTTTTVAIITTLRPTTTTAPPPTVTPPTAPPPTSPPTVPTNACADARADIAASGLVLPRGWNFYCPDPALDLSGKPHAGVACWRCNGPESYVAINPSRAGSGNSLRGVMAHEICHAVDWMTKGWTTEASADQCAASYGWPNPFAAAEGHEIDAFGPPYTPVD